jgi:hypothetical protein
MRHIFGLFIIFGAVDIAVAHSLSDDHGIAEQVGHQLAGIHHLPLTILLIAAGFVVLMNLYRKSEGRNNNK